MYNNNTIYKTLVLFKELLVINMLLHFYIYSIKIESYLTFTVTYFFGLNVYTLQND